MNLKRQILMVMGLIGLGIAIFLWWLPSNILLSRFREIETKDLQEKVVQAQEVIALQLETMSSKCADWAAWDDTYAYLLDHNKNYIKSNLSVASLSNLKIDFFLLLNSKSKVIDLFQIDLDKEKFLPISGEILKFATSGSSFLKHSEANSIKTGIAIMNSKVVLLTSQPVITSEKQGPVRGTLVFGRAIDASLLDRMRRVTHLDLDIHAIDPRVAKDLSNKHPGLTSSDSFAKEFRSEREALALSLLSDLENRPAALIEIRDDRSIYRDGKKTMLFVLSGVLLAGLFFSFGAVWFFQKQVLSRLFRLSSTVRKIGEEGSLDTRLDAGCSDELGDLSRSINYMLGLLDDSQKEIKKTTELLRHSNEQLVEKVVEAQKLNRQLEAAQQQLVQSQKLESIGRLAGGIAHDFNNILGAILGYVSMLETEAQTQEKLRRPVEVIRRSAERAAELTKQLLGFARMGNWEKKVVNLNASIEETVKLLSRSIPKDINIRMELTKPLRQIDADPTQIFQVLMNLALNSRDAMPRGGTILFQSENVDVDQHMSSSQAGLVPGEYIRIRVSDTGTGIPKDIQSKIFDPFFSTKEVGKGTGLGLSMAYGIVQAHKGAITLYSEEGVGTVFNIYFPAKAVATASLSQLGKEPIVELPLVPLRGRTILVVDDEELMREAAKDILEAAGAQVIDADSGLDGLEQFKAHKEKIDIVLTDLVMPSMNGIDLAKRIREMRQDIPVVLSSGYSESAEIQSLRKNPLVSFLQKPYRSDDLILAIYTALHLEAISRRNQNGG